jgi:tetratricopeptide (TPR) repeat protein
MKADHRHELKTNELADWLIHFPDWLRENRTSLISTAAVLIVAALVWFWIFYQKNIASARTQIRLTNLVSQLPRQKAEIARAMAQKTDQSYVLIDLARDLQDFAESAGKGDMAALALIERGDALRAELHYRLTEVSPEEVTKQIGLAQASYTQALEKAPRSPALTATARFGLGLCEEELGHLDKAREIYRDVAENSAYEGTAAKAAAANRLDTMDDYKGIVVFKPAPEPPAPAQASTPVIQIGQGDGNKPAVTVVPGDANAAAASAPAGTAPQSADATVPTPAATTPDANAQAGR